VGKGQVWSDRKAEIMQKENRKEDKKTERQKENRKKGRKKDG